MAHLATHHRKKAILEDIAQEQDRRAGESMIQQTVAGIKRSELQQQVDLLKAQELAAQQAREIRELEAEAQQQGNPTSSLQQPQQQVPELSFEERIEQMDAPRRHKDFVLAHPELCFDEDLNKKVQAIHEELLARNVEPYGDTYFDEIETRMGYRTEPEVPEVDELEDVPADELVLPLTRRGYSAPVSRDVPTSDRNRRYEGSFGLTAAQREAAKIAGCSEEEYRKGLEMLNYQKSLGNYGGQP
jgi:hypothetical protein